MFLSIRFPWYQKGYDNLTIVFILIVFHSGCLRLFSNLVVRELKIIHKKSYKLDIIVVVSNSGSILTTKEIMIITIVATITIKILSM